MKKAFVLLVGTLMLVGAATYASAGFHKVEAKCNQCTDGVELHGTSAGEKLVGGKEHDHIWGRGGDDRIWLGHDQDWAWGGKGNDHINAYANHEDAPAQTTDFVDCGPGNDVVKTGSGDNDVLTGCETVLVTP